MPPASIDAILAAAWQDEDIVPTPRCSDQTFLRRATLDLIGRIPTDDEFRAFAQNPHRTATIDRLIAHPLFARSLAEVFTASLVGYTRETPADREVLLQWLDAQLQEHARFDRIARSLIAAEGQSATTGPVNFVVRHGEDSSVQVCRQLLGVRLDCARCHDHPFARWTQDDFAAMSRFFESVRTEEISEGNIRVTNRPVRAPLDERPRFLTGARPRTSQWRSDLALFVTRSKPFARNFANRIWYHLMGRGIVHPPDDFHPENPAAVPKLLEFLAQEARDHQFDVRHLVRLICNSHAYQRASAAPHSGGKEARIFARRISKPLTPQQLYDSGRTILGAHYSELSRQQFVRAFFGESVDEDFLQTWKYRETVQNVLDRVTAEVPPDDLADSLDTIFIRVLSRRPTTEEERQCRDHSPGSIMFALMQSNEYVFNH